MSCKFYKMNVETEKTLKPLRTGRSGKRGLINHFIPGSHYFLVTMNSNTKWNSDFTNSMI